MNGTGLIGANGDTKVTYDNSRPQPNVAANGSRCEGSIGSVAGSGGMCLTPFFSVAADPSKYSIGDVICIPGLKGKKMKVTATRSVRHTGCLIVGDKGAAIKGEKTLAELAKLFDMTPNQAKHLKRRTSQLRAASARKSAGQKVLLSNTVNARCSPTATPFGQSSIATRPSSCGSSPSKSAVPSTRFVTDPSARSMERSIESSSGAPA
jgi:hypothetical protein